MGARVARRFYTEPVRYYMLLGVVLAAVIAPLWMVRFPGMIDYPDHLVRCYIIAHFSSNTFWHQFYRIEFGPIPNLAIDALVTPLAHWLPIIVSGRIFLTLLALLYVAGCNALGRAAGQRRHWLAPLAGLTLYNSVFLWGFVNYLFGLALCFLVFALWLRVRQRLNARMYVLLGALSTAVYLAHLAAVACLGVVCCAVAATGGRGRRSPVAFLRQTAWLAPPALLLLFGFMGRNGHVGRLSWSTPVHKLTALAAALLRSYSLRADMAIALGLLVCGLVLLWHCRFQRELAVGGVALLVCFVGLPHTLFTAVNADTRIAIPALVLLVLSVRPRWRRPQQAAFAAALLLLGLRVGLIARHWIALNARYDVIEAMDAYVPQGARVDVLRADGPPTLLTDKWAFAVPKIVDYWSVTRGSYESNVFAQAGQQPLIRRAAFAACWPEQFSNCLARFDFIFTMDPPAAMEEQVRAVATPVAHTSGATLWRVARRFRTGIRR